MTVQLTAVETVSDALFTCSYQWAHGKQYSRSDLDKALHQHKDPTTRYGKLVARLNQIAAMPYEALCDAGYLDTDPTLHRRDIRCLCSMASDVSVEPLFLRGSMLKTLKIRKLCGVILKGAEVVVT